MDTSSQAPATARRDRTVQGILLRCPRLVAHVIAESLGYATPLLAARIVADAAHGRPNWCEWIYSCYNGDARKVVENAVRRRHAHKGYMADHRAALALVHRAVKTGDHPLFASWF